MILSTAYLGNVQYYTKLLSGRAQIDLHEHYQKQSCRNRCDILSAGGPTTLVVPVCRPSGERVPVRDIRIDRTKKWRHQHFQALVSAYRRLRPISAITRSGSPSFTGSGTIFWSI